MLDFKNNNTDFNRIIVLDNPNKTLANGWNVALKETKGEVVVRVDAHSTFPNNFIEQNVKEIASGENIVGGKCISIVQRDTKISKLLLEAEDSLFGCGSAEFRRSKERKYVSTLAFAMYRKKVFDEVGEYNTNLARTEDNEMHYRMRKAGYKFLLSPDITTYRYARSSLKGMIKQKYENGKWIGITLKYCNKCFSLYHFVPLLFVLSIIICAILAIFNITIFGYLLIGAYLLFNIFNLLLITKKNKFKIEYLLLPFIFFILHFSYGFGTIIGILKIKE
jgi:cellulose synthase/poly-beta-1,6-N-acetylglucosamine synthase-like glycosyltransferase